MFVLTVTGAYAVRSERAGLNSPIHLNQAGLKQKGRGKKSHTTPYPWACRVTNRAFRPQHCPKEGKTGSYYDSDIAANALPISAQSNDDPSLEPRTPVCVCRSAAHAPPPLNGRRPVGTNISSYSTKQTLTQALYGTHPHP
ncbi:hypothetical protein JMJ77_0008118 [Colletotrichum scovillei]|uniref:Uncharacterized protein n=1 Tax=Colletotrichum scovillei TaxID=1209932 RepID=A0A9P7RDS9_9PEZI|nr:hypothetical protein JMJ77_0008118 [Colletotrichum scovillei]KAG7075143.1 hypothetical protein JMJ76_0011605 [Colletotrichum scovillei]KAG7082141.1 hypothetical protein JMJ78_0004246 [Colletotrichum scovillei]